MSSLTRVLSNPLLAPIAEEPALAIVTLQALLEFKNHREIRWLEIAPERPHHIRSILAARSGSQLLEQFLSG
jgi:hypothetical protein